MTTTKATSEPAYSDYQALRAAEREVLEAAKVLCEQGWIGKDVCEHFEKNLLDKYLRYRAMIEAKAEGKEQT